jgi:hypothetical protein
MSVGEDGSIPFVTQLQQADGTIAPNELLGGSTMAMLDELLRVSANSAPPRSR